MKRLIVSLLFVASAAVALNLGQDLLPKHGSQTLNLQKGSAATLLLVDGTAPPVPDVPMV
ncbi:MAG: hypothetical protein WCA38_17845 [Candidatus Acidiferrales bacterium]